VNTRTGLRPLLSAKTPQMKLDEGYRRERKIVHLSKIEIKLYKQMYCKIYGTVFTSVYINISGFTQELDKE